MKYILKSIVLSILAMGMMLSCSDKYEIDSQADDVVKTLTVTSDSVYYFEATSPRTVVVSINSSGAWDAVCSADWLSVDPSTSDSSSLITEITLSLEDNEESIGERYATITFSAEDVEEFEVIEIVQYGMVHLVVDSISDAFAEEGNNQTFTVLCNKDFEVTTSAGWLDISPNSGLASSEEQSISVTAASNAGQQERYGTIYVKTLETTIEFVVIQNGIYFDIVGEKEYVIPSAGSAVDLKLETSTTWNVIIPDDCDWLTASTLNGTGDEDVTFTISRNATAMMRSTYITFETPIENLNDSILITQETDAILFTEDNFEKNDWVTFNDNGSATLYAGPGTGSVYLKSSINDFSYGKYTVHFSDIQIAYTSSTMLMCITTEGSFNGGICLGAIAKPSYTDGWASLYWVLDASKGKKAQVQENDILRDDIKSYTIDVKKSNDEGMVDVEFYVNDALVASEQSFDSFANGDPMILTFWIYNYYDKENAAIFEPASLVYEAY